MATGGDYNQTSSVEDLLRSFEESCDYSIYHDEFNCTPCFKEGNDEDAAVYCPECKKYYCEPCKRQLNRFSLGQHHALIDRSQFENLVRQPKKTLVPKAKCTVPNHFGSPKTIYCEVHRVDCCANCAIKEHKSCESSLKIIPEEATGLSNRMEFHDLISSLQDLQKQYKELKLTVSTEKHEMEIERENIDVFIDNFKKNIYQRLEESQHSTYEILNDKFQEQEHQLNAELQKVDTFLDKIENYLSEARILRRSDCELYVLFKKGGHFKEEMESNLANMRKRMKRPEVKFHLDKKLEKSFDELTTLGNVSVQWEMTRLQALIARKMFNPFQKRV